MDAHHHATIADKLMQYWSQLPDPVNQNSNSMKKRIHIVHLRIDDLLKSIEQLAILEDEGLIR